MEYKTAIKKAEALCAKQEQCQSDIRKRLIKWGVSEDDCEKILHHLSKENFIDENRYATFYVRDKLNFNRWGKKKIWWHLKQKELPNEIIEAALLQINNDAYRETLEKVILEKLRLIKNQDPAKKKAAIIRNAISKGYEYQEVIPKVEQLMQ
jgi:regulatory protein